MKTYRWLKNPLVLVFTPLMLALLFAVACGAAATATPVPKPTNTPVPAPVATPRPAAIAATPVPAAAVAATPVPAAAATATPRPAAAVATPTPTFPTPTPTPKPTPAPVVVAAPRFGGFIPMQSYSFPPPNWHPHVTNTVQIMSSSGIYNQLIEYNAETEDLFDLRGDLAKSWDVTPDGKAYVFRLNEKARWHDGKPVTAVDVLHSLDSIVDGAAKPARAVTRPALLPYYKMGTARAIDDLTVEIPLQIPFAPDFIPTLALDFMKIVAKHWAESGVDIQKWENAMGSGPFKPGKFEKDVSIELLKNEKYWKEGLPRIDRMVHFTIVDKGTGIAAMKAEQTLSTNWGLTNWDNRTVLQLKEEAKGKVRLGIIPNAAFFFFFMNNSVPPFDNPKVRQAVNLALHRQAMFKTIGAPEVDTLGPGLGVGTWFGRTAEEVAQLPGWRELNGQKHPDDIAQAKKLLAEAGFPDGFKADMQVRQVVEFPDQSVIYKEQLKKIGIDATIKLVDSATGFTRYSAGDWVIGTQGSAHFVIEPDAILSRTLMPAGTWAGYARYSPPDWWQQAFAQQAGEPDRAKRKAILRKMEDHLIFEDPGCCPFMYWTARIWVINNKIKGVHASGTLWGGYKHETTYCDPKC